MISPRQTLWLDAKQIDSFYSEYLAVANIASRPFLLIFQFHHHDHHHLRYHVFTFAYFILNNFNWIEKRGEAC